MSRSWGVILIVLAVLVAYANSFSGAFVFDDQFHIIEHIAAYPAGSLWMAVIGSERPVTAWSFALNYSLHGLSVWGYHAVNVALHLAAGLLLFGILRQTFTSSRLRQVYSRRATGLAAISAVLWVTHPIQTQSVTYLIQRAEVIVGVCTLAMLYCIIRASASANASRAWQMMALWWCLLGMASKPVMVMAPLLIVFYDRIFLASSWRELWHRRRFLYAGLFGTWIILVLLVIKHPTPTAGFDMIGSTPLRYAWTQARIILHYLRLAVWPSPLVLDYGWPLAEISLATLPPVLMVALLLCVTLWLCRYMPPVGYLGVWWFVALAPTSSLLPVADAAVEHRMYLPLAAVTTAGVCIVDYCLRRLVPSPRMRFNVAVITAGLALVTLISMTVRRNFDYRNPETIWSDTVAKRPGNPRAHNNLGRIYELQRRFKEAETQFLEALRLQPDGVEAHHNLASVWRQEGRFDEALTEYARALQLNPAYVPSHIDAAGLLMQQGAWDAAQRHLIEAVRLSPDSARAHEDLGIVLAQTGRITEAIAHFQEAVRLKPHDPEVRRQLDIGLQHLREKTSP